MILTISVLVRQMFFIFDNERLYNIIIWLKNKKMTFYLLIFVSLLVYSIGEINVG